MPAADPKAVITDRKTEGLIDDLGEDVDDMITTAKGLQRSAVMRSVSSSASSAYSSAIRDLERAYQSMEDERGTILAGKAKDTRKFKGYVQSCVDGVVNLDRQNGNFQALEDANAAALITAFLGTYALLAGSAGELKRLQGEVASVSKKLDAAVKLARDTKIKAMVGVALTAATAALPPMGVAASVCVFVGGLAVDAALDSALAGREDTAAKAAWGQVDKAAGAADAFGKLPDSLGPVFDIINTGLDLSEAFASESEKQALFAQIKSLRADLLKLTAKFLGDVEKVKTAADKARSALADAVRAVNGFRPTTGNHSGLIRLL